MDVAREAAIDGRPRVSLPSFEARGEDGVSHWLYDSTDPAALRTLAITTGARPGPLPTVMEAVEHFGPIATPEVAAVCDHPGPLAAAELWRLASEWQVRPERALTGELWSLA